jgi:PAS domain S-box-containing protein
MSQFYGRTSRFFAARPALAVLVAAVVALAAAVARSYLAPAIGEATPFILLFPAVTAVAALAGPLAGVAALAVGEVATWLMLAPPGEPLAFRGQDVAILALATLAGGFMIWIAAELRSAVSEATVAKARLDAALSASRTGTWYWAVEPDRLEWDAALAAVFGIPQSSAPTTSDGFLDLVLPEDRMTVKSAVAGAIAGSGELEHEFRIRRGDGEIRWIYDRARVLRDPNGAPVAVLGACRDITSRRDIQERLRRRSAELEAVLAAAPAAVWFTDSPGVEVVHRNRLAAEAMRVRESDFESRMTMTDDRLSGVAVFHNGQRVRPLEMPLQRALAGDEFSGETYEFRYDDGGRRMLLFAARRLRDAAGITTGAVCAAVDVTERTVAEMALKDLAAHLETRVAEEVAARETAQAALARAQRLEAIGQLTGGIAHDFNNLLQALSGCLQMIQRRVPDPAVRSFIDAGQQAVERGGRLTQQLMAFARRQALRPEPTDVRNHVLGMAELLARALRADIDLAIEIAPDLWPIEVDPTQFEVALLNLAVNARDAMAEGGLLTIACRNAPAAKPGEPDFVEVSVVDTGSGIPPEAIDRVFEPFFTTKAVGKGSGLGLSQVYGFATQSGGTVRIDSTPGDGTTVTIVLPRSHGIPQQRAEPADHARGGTGGRILVVEDDPVVGTMVATMLRDFGYVVKRAQTADEAFELLEGGEAVDLVFSDVIMPGRLSGVDLARAVRELWPGLPVLLTTGYSENVAVPEGVRILSKPYQINLLLDAVENELRAHAPAAS